MVSQDPRTSSIPAHKLEEEEQSREGIGTQEHCTPGPGDLLGKHESTLHWALVVNGAGQQGELEHSGRLKLQSFLEDRHAPLVPLRPNTGSSFERFTTSSK